MDDQDFFFSQMAQKSQQRNEKDILVDLALHG